MEFANFFPTGGPSIHDSFNGSASRSAKVDTVLHNDLLTQAALQEALINCPIGFQYRYVPQRAFIPAEGKVDMRIVRQKFTPDIIINLESLSLKMTGDVHTGFTEVKSEPRDVNDGLYSFSAPVPNSYGHVLMDYTAIWEIQNVKDHTKKRVRETGRYVSLYEDDYAMNIELLICAKKIGKEFSSLFKNNYRHIF